VQGKGGGGRTGGSGRILWRTNTMRQMEADAIEQLRTIAVRMRELKPAGRGRPSFTS